MSYETIEHIDDRVAIAIRSSNYYANFTDNYEVKRNPGDPPLWECTCPGWLFRGRCRHVAEVRERLVEQYREVLG